MCVCVCVCVYIYIYIYIYNDINTSIGVQHYKQSLLRECMLLFRKKEYSQFNNIFPVLKSCHFERNKCFNKS